MMIENSEQHLGEKSLVPKDRRNQRIEKVNNFSVLDFILNILNIQRGVYVLSDAAVRVRVQWLIEALTLTVKNVRLLR